MIRLKYDTEDVLLSITKNRVAPIKQTHTKPQETHEFKITRPKQTFSFRPSSNLGVVCKKIIGLISLDIYKFVLKITEENNKFKLSIFLDSRQRGITYQK